jgi:hypothetical protein
VETQRQYLDWVYKKLGLKSMEDWYNVTNVQMREIGGSASHSTHNTRHSTAPDPNNPH